MNIEQGSRSKEKYFIFKYGKVSKQIEDIYNLHISITYEVQQSFDDQSLGD